MKEKKLNSKTSYIRPSRNYKASHFIVFVFDSTTQQTEKFVCRGYRILGEIYTQIAKVVGDSKERLWIVTESEVEMEDSKEYSKKPSWNDEAKILSSLEEEIEEKEDS